MGYKCNLEIKSFNFLTIKNKLKELELFLNSFPFIKVKGPVTLPLKKKKYTLLRSPHVHKTSQEHFGLFNYKSVLILEFPNQVIMDLVLNFIRKNSFLDSEIRFIKKIDYKY